MEGVETLRSEAVGGELRRLVDDMVSIACRMPDEIERIAEVREKQGEGGRERGREGDNGMRDSLRRFRRAWCVRLPAVVAIA